MTEGRAKQKGSVAWQGEDRTNGKGSGFKDTFIENPEQHLGRFPANLIHDGSDEVVGLFPNTKSGKLKSDSYIKDRDNDSIFAGGGLYEHKGYEADSGSAARFFYCAKASKSERNRGCEGMEDGISKKYSGGIPSAVNSDSRGMSGGGERLMKNFHPTVKPIALMEYLVKLVSREGAVVLDPFMGSGTTGIACRNLKRNFVGIEMSEEYLKIAEARINNVHQEVML